MKRPVKYTKVKVLNINQSQHETLIKLKSYNINVSNFIRVAIKEKINREYDYLKPIPENEITPF